MTGGTDGGTLGLLRRLSPGMLGSRAPMATTTGGICHGQLVTHRATGHGSLDHSLRTSSMFDSVACFYYGTATSRPCGHRLSAVAVRSVPSGWLRWARACGSYTCYPPRASWMPAVVHTPAQTLWRLDLADATADHQAHHRHAYVHDRRANPGPQVVSRQVIGARYYRSPIHVR
jgi:hypothetical protein